MKIPPLSLLDLARYAEDAFYVFYPDGEVGCVLVAAKVVSVLGYEPRRALLPRNGLGGRVPRILSFDRDLLWKDGRVKDSIRATAKVKQVENLLAIQLVEELVFRDRERELRRLTRVLLDEALGVKES